MHIGKKIETITKERGMQITELGRRLGKTSQSVYDIFRRESISTDLLTALSDILQHDFFKYYIKPAAINFEESGAPYGVQSGDKPYISLTINNIKEKDLKRIFKAVNEIL